MHGESRQHPEQDRSGEGASSPPDPHEARDFDSGSSVVGAGELDEAFDEPTVEIRFIWKSGVGAGMATVPPGADLIPVKARRTSRHLVEVTCVPKGGE